MELEFYGQIFEKYSTIKFRENPSSESRVVRCEHTDVRTWHDETHSPFLQFCERTHKIKFLSSQRDSNRNISRRKATALDSGKPHQERTEFSGQTADFICSEDGDRRITLAVRIYAPNYTESYAKLSRWLRKCTSTSKRFGTPVLSVYSHSDTHSWTQYSRAVWSTMQPMSSHCAWQTEIQRNETSHYTDRQTDRQTVPKSSLLSTWSKFWRCSL